MSQQELQKYRNDVISYVKCYPVKRNTVNLNTHNSVEHEQIKFRICYELKKQNIHFVTEAKMHDGKRGIADILVLDTGQIIEVLVSETVEKAKVKVAKYPDCVEVIGVIKWEDYFEGKYTVLKSKLL